MTDKPSPRLDAIRAMREATYERATAAQQEMARAKAALTQREKENTERDQMERSAQAFNRDLEKVRKAKIMDLEDRAAVAASKAKASADRRKAKKAKR